MIESKKPRKQRKWVYEAPLHIKRKLISAHLSNDLNKKYKRNSFPLKKGDEVQVMSGSFKKRSGKIDKINLKKQRVFIQGITRKTSAGTEKMVSFHASKLKILNFNLSDKRREKVLSKKIPVKEETKVAAIP